MTNYLVVFVCTGNICRSPMAEGILKDIILDAYQAHNSIVPVEVLSAGTRTQNGHPASGHAVHVAKKHGINLNFHRSRVLTEPIMKTADLLLTMETAHRDYIKEMVPESLNVHPLKAYGRNDLDGSEILDVFDPIGSDYETYREVFDELQREIGRVKDIIFDQALKKYRSM